MYWDVWKDSAGYLLLMPAGSYRIAKVPNDGRILLIPLEEGESSYDITRGAMLGHHLGLPEALQFVLPPVEGEPPA